MHILPPHVLSRRPNSIERSLPATVSMAQIRKLVASACTFDKQTALDPGRLSATDLARAAERARQALGQPGKGGAK